MTSIGHLYWTLLEPNLSDPDLYFPADTPLGHVNPKRHYNHLRKRHIRQRERLIQLQVKELDEYQKSFSIEYKDDLIIKPTITATELVTGSDFLTSSSHIITELLSTIPDQIIENQNKPSETIRKAQEQEMNANKREYSEILKNKYDAGLEGLNKTHHLQWEVLAAYQAGEMEVIPKEIQDPPLSSSSTSPSHSRHRSSPRSPPYNDSDRRSRRAGSNSPPKKRVMHYEEASDKYYKKGRDVRDEGSKDSRRKERRDDRDHATASTSSPSGKSRHDNNRASKDTPSSTTVRPPVKTVRDLAGQKTIFNTGSAPPGRRPPTVTGTVGIPPGGKPPTVSSTTVGIPPGGRPPVVGSTVGIPPGGRPPTIGTSNGRHRPSSRADASHSNYASNRRDSLPLFGSTPTTHKITSLLDRGTISILKKPNRVIIRGPNGTSTNYGDPKDYDDAINSSVERPDNPVYKRHTQGQDYLFYKTESGTVVTIGPVSKIQPLIHKFFLST